MITDDDPWWSTVNHDDKLWHISCLGYFSAKSKVIDMNFQDSYKIAERVHNVKW